MKVVPRIIFNPDNTSNARYQIYHEHKYISVGKDARAARQWINANPLGETV